MAEEIAAKHNRLFQEASAIIKGQISVHGQADLPAPGWLITRKLKQAVNLFEQVLQINPENWSAMWLIGKIQQRLRHNSEALSWFERSYQVNPSQPDVAREASLCAMDICLYNKSDRGRDS
jgi:tetratricopeptide (TPR) repeat protein